MEILSDKSSAKREKDRSKPRGDRVKACVGWLEKCCNTCIALARSLPPPLPPASKSNLSYFFFCGFHADQQPSRILKTLEKANASSVYLSFIPIASRTISFLLCTNPCGFAVLSYYPRVKLLPYSCCDFRVLDLNICKYGGY